MHVQSGPSLRCAVVTPIGPGHREICFEMERSVERAFALDAGPFAALELIHIDDGEGRLGRSKARNLGVRRAQTLGCEWVLFLDADDLLAGAAFRDVAPLLATHDGIWGAISSFEHGAGEPTLRDPQVKSFHDIRFLLLADPFTTLQMGHFVRTALASRCPFDERLDAGEDFDYYLRVWEAGRCIKIDHPLFHNRRGLHSTGPRSADGRAWREAAKRAIAGFCAKKGLFSEFVYRGQPIRFALRDAADIIERQHLAKRFFEQEELEAVATNLAPGASIVEVGAHSGNHVVYYCRFMGASRVTVLEPNPAARELLAENLQLNGCEGLVDLSRMTFGAGARRARARLLVREAGNLGACGLAVSPEGEVEIAPLDDLIVDKPDLIKIDVEGMELEVLNGARRLLAEHSPLVFVEVMRQNIPQFEALLKALDYRVHVTFPYVNAVNVIAGPRRVS